MAGKVRIGVTAGPIKGKEFVYDEHDTLLFGRAPDCHARLPHEDRTGAERGEPGRGSWRRLPDETARGAADPGGVKGANNSRGAQSTRDGRTPLSLLAVLGDLDSQCTRAVNRCR